MEVREKIRALNLEREKRLRQLKCVQTGRRGYHGITRLLAEE
jgi:hypothetical protein